MGEFIAIAEYRYSYASQTGWVRQTYQLDSGHQVYVYPANPQCLVHWEISRADLVVGYQPDGACPCLRSVGASAQGSSIEAGRVEAVAMRRSQTYLDWHAGLADLSDRFYWYYVPRCD